MNYCHKCGNEISNDDDIECEDCLEETNRRLEDAAICHDPSCDCGKIDKFPKFGET